MNKGLEALKELKAYGFYFDLPTFVQMRLDIIESDLKENAELKKMIRNVNESIGEPQIISPTIEEKIKDYDDIKDICNSYNIEFNLINIRKALFTLAQLKGEYGTNWDNYNKKLKALDIIREVILEDLAFDDKEQAINFSFGVSTLCIKIKDKPKYDLLKEVYDNGK